MRIRRVSLRRIGLIALLSLISLPVLAVQNPQGGSVGLSGKVSGPPPSRAATIDIPLNGAVITSIPVQVSGQCQPDLLIKIFKNEVFAGSTVCESSGSYSLLIDLFTGANNLVARVYDDADQQGPDSNVVRVTYVPSVNAGGIVTVGDQLILRSDYSHLGVAPGSSIEWPIEISGGQPPYAISWDWGDGTVDPIVRSDQGLFRAKHTYAKAGIYHVIIQATDKSSRRAYLQVITIVNGGLGTPTTARKILNDVVVAWPIFIIIILIFICGFLLGWWRRGRHDGKQNRV